MSSIYALIDPRNKHVFHVGCAPDPEKSISPMPLPVARRLEEIAPDTPQMVILQSEEVRPLSDWAKWSKRFRRDIVTDDWKNHPLADAFTNSPRLRRARGEEVAAEGQDFSEFDLEHPEIFAEILRISLQKQKEGYKEYSIHGIVSEIRYEHRFKICNAYCAFYARKVQMVDPSLLGFFEVVACGADDLVLEDGRSWREFSKEHADAIRYSAHLDLDEEDWGWTY